MNTGCRMSNLGERKGVPFNSNRSDELKGTYVSIVDAMS